MQSICTAIETLRGKLRVSAQTEEQALCECMSADIFKIQREEGEGRQGRRKRQVRKEENECSYKWKTASSTE